MLGIFVNVDSREFQRVPSYLTIITDRPIAQIAGPEALRRLQVGMDNYILTQRVYSDFADTVTGDPFRQAFIRLKQQQNLYGQSASAVTFLTPTVFRASIPVPANAATGRYDVDVKLFAQGAMVARTATSFNVTKAGVEQYVVEASQEHGLLYGLATMSMALAVGWLASAAFRRDLAAPSVATPGGSRRRRLSMPSALNEAARSALVCLKCAQPSQCTGTIVASRK